jgi:hypothetical protein
MIPMLTPYRMSEPLDGDKSIAAPRLFGEKKTTLPIPSAIVE